MMKLIIAGIITVILIYLLATTTGYATIQSYKGKITDNTGRALPEGRLEITNIDNTLAGKGGVTLYGYSFTVQQKEIPIYTITYINYQDRQPRYCTKIDLTQPIKNIKCEFKASFPVITKALTKGETFYIN